MAERGDGRARRRRTSADVQWAKVHGCHLSIPIEWLDKRRHDHVALGRGYWLDAQRAMATIARVASIVSIDKFISPRRATCAVDSYRCTRKRKKIRLSWLRGFPSRGVPRCATTASRAS